LFELHFPLLAFRSAAWLAASRSNALDDSDANSAYAVEAPYSIIRQIEHLNEAIIGAPSMILLHSLAGPADVHTLDVKDFVDCLRRARLLVASQHAMFTELVKASEHSLQASKEILMSLEARTKLHLIRRKTS
jgi:hypothetical protein